MIVKMDNFLHTLLWKSDESRAHSLLKRKRLLLKSKYWCNHSFFVFVFCTQVSRLKRNKKLFPWSLPVPSLKKVQMHITSLHFTFTSKNVLQLIKKSGLLLRNILCNILEFFFSIIYVGKNTHVFFVTFRISSFGLMYVILVAALHFQLNFYQMCLILQKKFLQANVPNLIYKIYNPTRTPSIQVPIVMWTVHGFWCYDIFHSLTIVE